MIRLLVFILCVAAPAHAEPEIGMAFPPVGSADQLAFTQTALGELGISQIRIAENWKRRGLTPTPQEFAPLVRRITNLRARGLRIMLTVQADGPNAACEQRNDHGCLIAADAPFESYVTALLEAVGPQLDSIQFGNEWDNQFAGTPAQYLALQNRFARVVRDHQPDLTIVLGGITGGTPYFSAVCIHGIDVTLNQISAEEIAALICANQALHDRAPAIAQVFAQADYDIVDIHLYDAPPLWPAAIAWVQARSSRTIWVSEFGGPNPDLEPRDPAYQASQLTQYIATIRTLPIARAYYFKLMDDPGSYHANSGLFTRTGQPKPALPVFVDALR